MVKPKPKTVPQKRARRKKFTRPKKKAKIDPVALTDEQEAGPSQLLDEKLSQSSDSDLVCGHPLCGQVLSMVKSPLLDVTLDDAKSTELISSESELSVIETVSLDLSQIEETLKSLRAVSFHLEDHGDLQMANEATEPSQQSEGNGDTEPSQNTVHSGCDHTNSPMIMNIPAAEDTIDEEVISSGLLPDFQSGNVTCNKDGPPKSWEETLLGEVRKNLLLLLPDCWVSVVRDGGIHIGLWAKSKVLLVQRSMFFAPDGTTSITVHGKELPGRHKFWQDVKKVVLQADSVKQFAENIVGLAKNFRLQEICAGAQHNEDLWNYTKDCTIDKNDFNEIRYVTTCRSNSCLLLVPNLKTRRCEECGKVHRGLSKRNERRPKNDDVDATPKKTKPDSALCALERKKRMQSQSKKVKSLQEGNKRLKETISKLMKNEGFKISADLSADLSLLLESAEGLTDFQKLFIEQQLKASSVKKPSGMRWHPALIRFALSLWSASPATYEDLSSILKLPLERQLFDYSHVVSAVGTLDGVTYSNELVEGSLELED